MGRRRQLRRTRALELAALLSLLGGLAVAVPAFSSENAPTRSFVPAPLPPVGPPAGEALAAARAPLPSAPAPVTYVIARPRAESLTLHARPGGRALTRLSATTEFGSARRFGVVRRVRAWLGVPTPALPNGRLGWIHERDVRLSRTSVSLTLDLSKRRLYLRKGGKVIRRITIGVGRAGSPTPVGRFAVTDKLSGARYGPYYGCCIVALSARQPHLPPGWTGGDRIAIHGTNDPSSIGRTSSAGCPHAGAADMQALMEIAPLGAPVFVRA
ncbi:MAG: L,D-transpeptidase [Actinobacteria bacterium]|nr:L,D-transpeptidase [Actinomycetota bacterium]